MTMLACNCQDSLAGPIKPKRPLQLPVLYQRHAYGYYDFVREVGLGYEYRFLPKFAIDARLNVIYPYSPVASSIYANDFAFYKGFSATAVFKNYSHLVNGLFVGISAGYAHIGYRQKWAEPQYGYSKYSSEFYGEKLYLRNRVSDQVSLGLVTGLHLPVKHIYLEPFVGVSMAFYNNDRITYNDPNIKYGYSDDRLGNRFCATLGIKLGFQWKRFSNPSSMEAAVNKHNALLVQAEKTANVLYQQHRILYFSGIGETRDLRRDYKHAYFTGYMLRYREPDVFSEKLNAVQNRYDRYMERLVQKYRK